MLAVCLFALHGGGPQANPGPNVVHKGYVICQDACVWCLLEESAGSSSCAHCHIVTLQLPRSEGCRYRPGSFLRQHRPMDLACDTRRRSSSLPWYVFPYHSQRSAIIEVKVLLLSHALLLFQGHAQSAETPHAQAVSLNHAHATRVGQDVQHVVT